MIKQSHDKLIEPSIAEEVKVDGTTRQDMQHATIPENHALHTQLKLLESIIARLPGHIYWQDKNDVFLGCNDQQAKHAGLKSRQEIIGKTNFDMPWKGQAKALNSVNRKVRETGQPYVVEEFAEMANGKGIFLSEKVPLHNDQGEIIGTLGVSFDITDRKKMEEKLKEALEKVERMNKAKAELLAIVNQELRIPLTNIIGMLDMLKITGLNQKQQEYFDTIYQASHSITPLLDYVMNYLNFEAGKIEPFEEKILIKCFIEDWVRKFAMDAYSKDTDIVIDFSPRLPEVLTLDSIRFGEVLKTLLYNAVRFTQSGHIIVKAEIIEDKDKFTQIKVSVIDTGCGLTEGQSQHLLSLFDLSTIIGDEKSHYQAGLRLSICKQMLQHIGGNIGLASNPNKGPNKGSTFWFSLPCILSVQEDIVVPSPLKIGLSILLVDDNHERAAIYAKALTNYQHKTTITGSKQALTLLKKEKNGFFDLVLIDANPNNIALEKLLSMLGNTSKNTTNTINFALLIYPNFDKAQLDKLLTDYPWLNVLTKPLYPSHLSSLLLDATHRVSTHKIKALLVEDNLQNQLVIKTLLETLDCEVKAVSTGNQALACIDHAYDIIFMDLNLPDADGIQVTGQFKETHLHANTPIIAVTAHASEEEVDKFINMGGTNILAKPVGIESLKKILGLYVLTSSKN